MKQALENDKDLAKEFARLSHGHHDPNGKFFATKLSAIGYLKEDVFCSEKRTDRVFKFLVVSKQHPGWEYDEDTMSDQPEPQEQESDDEDILCGNPNSR